MVIVRTKINAGLRMGIINWFASQSPRASERKDAMASGIMDFVLMEWDASSDMKQLSGKLKPIFRQ